MELGQGKATNNEKKDKQMRFQPTDPVLCERIVELTRNGWSGAQIADELGMSTRTVSRVRSRAGVASFRHRKLTEAETQFLRQLLEDGCTYGEAARTIGRRVGVIKKHFPGYDCTREQQIEAARLARNFNRLVRDWERAH